jgi:hypothetical protein
MEEVVVQYVREVYKNGEQWLEASYYTYTDHPYYTLAEES